LKGSLRSASSRKIPDVQEIDHTVDLVSLQRSEKYTAILGCPSGDDVHNRPALVGCVFLELGNVDAASRKIIAFDGNTMIERQLNGQLQRSWQKKTAWSSA